MTKIPSMLATTLSPALGADIKDERTEVTYSKPHVLIGDKKVKYRHRRQQRLAHENKTKKVEHREDGSFVSDIFRFNWSSISALAGKNPTDQRLPDVMD